MSDLILSPGEYLTYRPISYIWEQGQATLRLNIPAGQNTDYASIPTRGVPGWLARRLGFRPDDPTLIRASKVHDMLCYHIRVDDGVLPEGYYQYVHPDTRKWENVATTRWRQREADKLWRKIAIEDGFPEWKANVGHQALRRFGWAHRLATG